MERTIGNLGEEIKQHTNAFANLAQHGIRRCQVNALKAMIPDIEPPENPIPRGGRDLGDGYVLLRAMDNTSREVRPCEHTAIAAFLHGYGVQLSVPLAKVTRWARLRLPNGQIARSQWKKDIRRSRNVVVSGLGTIFVYNYNLFMP